MAAPSMAVPSDDDEARGFQFLECLGRGRPAAEAGSKDHGFGSAEVAVVAAVELASQKEQHLDRVPVEGVELARLEQVVPELEERVASAAAGVSEALEFREPCVLLSHTLIPPS